MVIVTKIVKKSREKDVFEVTLDNGYTFQVFDEFIILYHIAVNAKFDDEIIKEVKHKSDQKIAQNVALKTLARGIKTKKELENKLKQKNIEQDVIQNVVLKMLEYGYINDELYAKQYIGINKSNKGKRRIIQELEQKGVQRDIIENLLEEQSDEDWIIAIKNIAEKYMKNKDLSYKNKTKLYNHLLSKGFDYGQISKIMLQFNWESDSNYEP
jgi:regulatory protein